ncbi:hypothetical protein FE633_28440 [Streptomyces montanus]|uniref:Type IV secretion protein Rhs n=1 Tax=Streptomyces montanus TaxID=2580423 RepID=A0A5R9FGJ0_9ACTN|nr:DUF6531 domain-containing protein [Streptomyces montanus]TLS42927.1 hypothetical protein FE633_28440 [Streptomyces montanus]
MAGYRPTDWHVLDLEKDPTPGDPDRVRSLAKSLHDFADDVQDALRLVKGMAEEEAVLTWVGKTAEVFQDEFSGVPKNLKKLKKSYDLAGDALAAYWPKLERAQALADKALAKGREAQADLSSAKSRLSTADSWVSRASKEADKYKDDKKAGKDVPKPDEDKVRAATRDAQNAESAQTSAQSDVNSAQSALDAAKKMAADARQMREDAAGEAKRKLDEASDAGIQNRKWYEEVGDWFEDNWDTIVAVCKVVVAVLGIIAMIIGGPILGAIVLIAALVVLADTLNKYAKGQASLWDVAFAALDCIPGMKGLTSLRGLAKGLKGLKGLKAGLKGMANGVRGLGKSARGALADGAKGAYNRLKSKIKGCGDPVDAATGQMFLSETDVTLPGTLPLTFTRRVASGYRTGWWFGPTWSSTIDQRLEVDENGVVFVTEDGMLLAYPHTAAQDPVLPETGPRWPLTRLDTGGYRIDDPIAGRSRHFAAPAGQLALLERISDRNGNTIDFHYDADGSPHAIRHSGGYHLTLTVEEGRVTALGLADAAEDGAEVTVKRYGYDDGNLTSVTNSSGLPMRFAYDERLRITSWTDTNNSSYAYTYDDQDRCLTQAGEAGHVANSFAYDGTDQAWPGHRVTTVTTPEGATSRFIINDNCQVVAEIDPLGSMVRTTYDTHHHLVSTTDELGHTTRLVNNALGQATEVTYPDGAVISYAFNDLNLPISLELPDGSRWLQQYDEVGNCTAVTDPVGVTTRYAYTEHGHLSAITDALGHTTTVRCNPAGLPLENINPLGAVTAWERDAFGRPVAQVDPLGHTTRFSWTREGLPARRITPDGAIESWTYDGEGNCTSHTDQIGQISRFEYTHFDLVSARTDPDGSRHEFRYDSSLRLTNVVNPQGMTWSYTYDAAGNLISETDFDNRTIAYTCDAAGRYTSRTNAFGQTVRYERDELGRVVRKDAGGQITTYAYSAADQLSEVTGPDATLARRYDRAGRLVSEAVNGRNMIYAYDELGRRIRRTTPSGAVSTWEFDAADNQTRLTASGRVIGFRHDAMGRELTRQVGEFASMACAFDELGRITTNSISTAVAPEIQRRAYSYRQDGNLVRLDDKLNGTRRYDMDAAGRVTAVEAHDWSERYAYDDAGNQSSASWPAMHPGQESVGSRRYNGTRIEKAGSTRYEHDALGRITMRQKTRLSRKPDTWRYEWDAEDQLTAVVTPDGTRWRYQYDPLGRRISKQRLAADGETAIERIDFTWDGTTLCEQTTRAPALPDPVTVTWDYDGLHPISQTERITAADTTQQEVDSRFFAIVTDLIGTPTELIDESGAIAWRARATLWGTTSWASKSTTYTPLRFPGQYYDAETGLHYNYFRHYDPETARYLTSDPLGLTPAPNPTTYVHNPLTWVDPLGLAPKCPKGKGDEPPQRKTSNEEHEYFDSFNEARANAKQRAQLGDDQIPFVQELGPHRGRVTGMQSPDGNRGWRIDFDPKDPDKGFHVNWWNREGRKRSDNWKLGANTVRGGTEADYLAVLEHFPHT